MDETETPTTPAEHVYFATELRRLGVQWVSLAPRYVGRFEKGVDYIGDLAAFTANFAIHAAIARTLGPYKLSLHSGSDKFSIYEIAARETQGFVHLKTAGTSYLEALRTVAQVQPDVLRDIYAYSLERIRSRPRQLSCLSGASSCPRSYITCQIQQFPRCLTNSMRARSCTSPLAQF